jgi:hypothetical protein
MQALQEVKGGDVDAGRYYLIRDDELTKLQRSAAADVTGVVWKADDVIHRIGGVERTKFNRLIIKYRAELLKIGALLTYPEPGHRRKYQFRASAMAPWLDAHLEEFKR